VLPHILKNHIYTTIHTCTHLQHLWAMSFTNTSPTAQQHEEARAAVALPLRYDRHTKKARFLGAMLHQYWQGWLKKKTNPRAKKQKLLSSPAFLVSTEGWPGQPCSWCTSASQNTGYQYGRRGPSSHSLWSSEHMQNTQQR